MAAKKLCVRAADQYGHYGNYTSNNNYILFDTIEERKVFLDEFACSGRVWLEQGKDSIDPMELMPQEVQVVDLKSKVEQLEAALAAATKK